MTPSRPQDLIHDWNATAPARAATTPHVLDETLRDGLQAPSARMPPVEERRALLHAMADIGVHAVNLGMPATGARAAADVLALARELASARLPLVAGCAARARVEDVHAVADIAQRAGIPIEVGTFVPSSALRHHVDGRTLDDALRCGEAAVTAARRAGLSVMFVAEDATRTHPALLRTLLGAAIEWGAGRLCLADTAGHATPEGARALVRFVRRQHAGGSAACVSMDWHGHDDRGLALPCALAALDAGADRVHATALGIGERAGNVAMETLLVNLRLAGLYDGDLAALPRYAAIAARACGVRVSPRQPVVGRDAFRTGSGTHASSLLRARRAGARELEDALYSSVPAASVGAAQAVEVTPVSGRSNVRWWLLAHGYDAADDELVAALLAAAKRHERALADEALHGLVAATLASRASGASVAPAVRA